MKLQEYCAKYVANLRSLYLLHQHFHWLTNGPNFYGNHQLFERLYKSAQENADLAAEKLIGIFGSVALDVKQQPDLLKEFLDKFPADNAEDMIIQSLKAEMMFLSFSKEFYDFLKKEEKLSLGLDDAIMSISSERESSVYLLKQVLGDRMNKLSTLAHKFSKKLAQIANDPTQLENGVRNAIAVHLANKNWGEVGFNNFSTKNQADHMVFQYNVIVPENSAPFTDKVKYPGGLNQFKQEIMKLVSDYLEQRGMQNVMQIITVNGK